MKHLKAILVALGCLCVVLGFLGIFIPLFPTTPFILLASFLFFRSSPKFHKWLENSKLFGPYLQEWHNGKGFSHKRKRSILILQGIITIATLLFAPFWLAKVVVCISFVGISIFMLWLPTVQAAPSQFKHGKQETEKQDKKK